ncbi:hypothetical protein OS965_02345 [Streptomyces sp. H27-G5]|uniref:hypothetical protein n=1 Tax=Streptomyces sp. H27-G5 TaxID=2996698 RepID=UPI00226E115E|nr:hypothetical protein [Streptomyces sp. H27-G5]MCY0917016.1 hypothetical protein [Streptomyces sp. H27-G5]
MAYEQDDFDISDVMSAEELYEDDRTAEFRQDAEDEDRYADAAADEAADADHGPWLGLADGEER